MVNRGRLAATREVLEDTARKGADAADDSIRGRRKDMISRIGLRQKQAKQGRLMRLNGSFFGMRGSQSVVINRFLYSRLPTSGGADSGPGVCHLRV